MNGSSRAKVPPANLRFLLSTLPCAIFDVQFSPRNFVDTCNMLDIDIEDLEENFGTSPQQNLSALKSNSVGVDNLRYIILFHILIRYLKHIIPRALISNF